jgi:DNA-binding NarL/FixJ family response regulator
MLNKQENMSTGSLRLFERKKTKAAKVLELFNQGYSYRKIAKLVHLSLRDVSKFINLAADKYRTPSTTSIHDLILEYRVSNYRHELRDLRLEKETVSLMALLHC